MDMDFSPLWISIKTAASATTITFFLGLAAAWYVNKLKSRYKNIIDALLILPMVLPPTVMGFFLLLIFGKRGFIGKILDAVGIQVIFSWQATVIAAIAVSFPLMYKASKSSFAQVDKNITDAARTLGGSSWNVFWKITVPASWPGIAAGTVLSFARALGEFGATLMIAGNITGKTQTMPLAIFFASESGKMDQALMWVLMITSISFVFIILINHWEARR
jgi:molybdate transport system permease protein